MVTINKILSKVVKVENDLTEQRDDVWGKDGIDERFQLYSHQADDTLFELSKFQTENDNLKKEMKTMKVFIVKLERIVQQQVGEILDLKARSMRKNILMHGLKAKRD
ncbi:hypothetical protein KUTeg_005048 [Tegillarca granosa]|uniref:Uncharacterized protein n=1 Tax=Tegillarca granosa TaxID=220873 RepID=A0ABQ9FIP5_TEGGR|nr:hypothetical protein KUTeg_005048 [Tegillarca granosa]